MNDSSPPSPTHALWDRLANRLNTEEGWETAMLMRQSQLLKCNVSSEKDNQASQEHTAPLYPRAIGPWEPKKNGNNWEFVRESKWDKYLWLESRDVLTPKNSQENYRVCLIGESVAAGMFFSPHISPAKVLNSILTQNKPTGAKQVEVIDLTRNAMRAELLIDIADSAAQLNPNVIIIFAGNNFCRNHTIGRPDERNTSHTHLDIAHKQGATGLIKHFTQALALSTKGTVETIANNAKRTSTKIVWLIPATNEHWQRLAPIHWLGGGKTNKWYMLLNKALSALDLGRYRQALELAQEMKTLDSGTCPTTHRLIAIAYHHLGEPKEYLKHCQNEVDIDCALERNSFLSPGIQSTVKSAILEGGKQHGFNTIDLQNVFTEHLNSLSSPIDYFVDYCHLSIDGMRIAMSAVASILPDTASSSWKEILQKTHSDTYLPKHIARGLFEATIYTSHMQHTLGIKNSKNHLRQRFHHALKMWDGLANTMTEYIRMRHGAVVSEVSKNAHEIVSSANSLLDYGILQWIHGIDSQTIEAICGALSDAGHTGDELLSYYQEYDKNRLKHGIDLTNPRYIKYFGRDGEVDWDPERGTYRTQPYLRAYWPCLPLVFASTQNTSLSCSLTSRLPKAGGKERSGTLKITINGNLAANIPISHVWSRHYFNIAAEHVTEGFNDIELEWPSIPDDDTPALNESIKNIQTFGRANWHPVFGEVFSFRIAPSST